MNSSLVHPVTSKQLEAFLKMPSHALLLAGAKGAGKTYLGRQIAAQLLEMDEVKLDNYPHFSHISKPDDKQNITIEAIRAVNKSLMLKIPGVSKIKRVILIEDAHFMNQEAQNALLKSLEEPSEDTVFILTTYSDTSLLGTVVSRSTLVNIRPISLDSALSFFKDQDEQKIKTAWQLSGGSVGLLAALLNEEKNELKEAVEQAKKILSQSKYERLLTFDSLSRDKDKFNLMLEGLAKVIQALYKNSVAKDKKIQTRALLESMRLVVDAQEALARNVLPKLIALKLALKLPI